MAQPLRQAVAAVLLALPWLAGASVGPMPSMLQWGVSGCAVVGLLLMNALYQPAPRFCWAEAVANGLLIAAVLNAGIVVWHLFASSATGDANLYGPLRQRNQLASLMNLGLLCLAWRARTPGAWTGRRFMPCAMIIALLLGAINGTSSSRTGVLQLLVIMVFLGIWHWWSAVATRAVMMTALLAYIASNLLMLLRPDRVGALARIVDAESSGCSSRLVLWRNVFELIGERPWSGWGWGELDYAHYITDFGAGRFCEILDNAHNLPLHLAVEWGVPVALLFCVAVAWWLARAKPWLEAMPHRQLAWGILALLCAHSLVEYPLWYGPFLMLALMSCGLLLQPLAWLPQLRPAAVRVALSALAMTLLALVLVTGWNYHRITQLYLPYESRDEAYRTDTLTKVRDAWPFGDQVGFAELTVTSPDRHNAERLYALAQTALHFSPEPRVIERLIDSARITGRDAEARLHEKRYAAAFPQAFANWQKARAPATASSQ